MTRLWNDPANFVTEMTDGFLSAYPGQFRHVPGGVVRAESGETPQVSLVIGGGSGHFPAFAGLVGPGLAAGAVMGNLFASPSAHHVETVVQAAHSGHGVLLSYGNYAGDVMHFSLAQDRLRAAGIDCRTVRVTDDIFSAAPENKDQRRGIAGDLVVFKVAGAACAANYPLDDVERIATLANDRTRSMGVAFSGCTLPGAAKPLFDVAPGRMAIGLGIHGEPGIDEIDTPSADELAELFVSHLLSEVPEGLSVSSTQPLNNDGDHGSPDPAHKTRVIPILNGLGSVKAEELYVVYRRIDALLRAAGLEPVNPQVGEFCTSFDMAGASLTLFWPDQELEALFSAPASSAGYRTWINTPAAPDSSTPSKPAVSQDHPAPQDRPTPPDHPAPSEHHTPREQAQGGAPSSAVTPASPESQRAAHEILRALNIAYLLAEQQVEEWGRLDAIAGDGDHGIGMLRGAKAARDAAHTLIGTRPGAQAILQSAGQAWAEEGGGTSGAIWGLILETLGAALGNTEALSAVSLGEALAQVSAAVQQFGQAKPGDKTLVDALTPFALTFNTEMAQERTLPQAWARAAQAAYEGAQQTADMLPRMGRARTHGSKAVGTPDPGAFSFAQICQAIRG